MPFNTPVLGRMTQPEWTGLEPKIYGPSRVVDLSAKLVTMYLATGEESISSPAFAKLLAETESTLRETKMLTGVDKLGVAISGGADSLSLLAVLAHLCSLGRLGKISLHPLHIDQYGNEEDVSALVSRVKRDMGIDVDVVRRPTELVALEMISKGKAPCRACAPVRRAALLAEARQLGLDAVAIGHHLNDAVATLLMNVIHHGSFRTFPPIHRAKGKAPIVRPFIYSNEVTVKDASPFGESGLFPCRICSRHATERDRVSRFVRESLEHPTVDSTLAAVVRRVVSD